MRLSSERAPVVLLGAVVVAYLAVTHLTYVFTAVLALASLVVVLLAFLPGDGHVPRWAISVAGGLALVALVWEPPVSNVVTTPWLNVGIAVGAVTAAAVAMLPWVPQRWWWVVLLVLAAGYVLVILGGPPLIDVWVILHDSALGLLRGLNPYEMHFPDVPAEPPVQTSNCFNYLPATFLLTAPSQWLFGDVRWLETGYLFGAVALLGWHTRRWPLALLVGALPGTLYVVQQAWTEPMLLLGLVAGYVLIERGRANWAIVPIALALATKQHMVVLVPLLAFWPKFGWRRVLVTFGAAAAVCLPWVIADPGRFRTCTVDFFLFAPMQNRSVSFYQLIPAPLGTLVVVAVLALAYWLVIRSRTGFLLGAGVVLVAFNLVNKQTFLNQWVFAAELIVAGLAVISTTPVGDTRDPFPE
ncbi:hypothetical protein [Kutzneria sp. CA-103260]|uniref:hypothetical protein n=1 Tax=Kutzneria sp. CA-103260 TaxID=2802641 RepID=UPI001BA748D2|nr:hypothetical protein [Kutzneria sp. CA-103260]QUQ70069.1 hypothetical protein JJ691_78400 [Kutzneria sp. CA-103260]